LREGIDRIGFLARKLGTYQGFYWVGLERGNGRKAVREMRVLLRRAMQIGLKPASLLAFPHWLSGISHFSGREKNGKPWSVPLGKKRISTHNKLMRQIGNKTQSQPGLLPSEDSLRLAGIHQSTGHALAALATTGVAKGIYRFATHAEMNRHCEDALARAIAANIRERTVQGGRR
jgi:hypothetical protein